jgi:dolichol kinase
VTQALTAGSVLLLVAMLGAATWLARRADLHPEVARKMIHVGLGLYCMTFPAMFDEPAPVLEICGAALIILLGVRVAKARGTGLAGGLHGVARHSYGEILFAVSVALLFVLGHTEPVTYLVPLAILTLSDAAAAVVGVRYGRAHFRVAESYKTVEGAVIFFLTAWIITMILLLAFSSAPRLNVIVFGCLIALYGTLVEASSWDGWDNFFLPMAIFAVLQNNLEAPPTLLLEGAAIGAAALAATLLVRAFLGLDAHAAAFMATVLATIGMASSTWNVIVPALALACHLAVERSEKSLRSPPHLRLSLVMVLLAFTWYLVPHVTPYPTIGSFNLCFAAFGVALVAGRGRFLVALTLVPVFLGAMAIRPVLTADTALLNTPTLKLRVTVLLLAAILPAAARFVGRSLSYEGLGLAALGAGAVGLGFVVW